jgi:hypothetical protein
MHERYLLLFCSVLLALCSAGSLNAFITYVCALHRSVVEINTSNRAQVSEQELEAAAPDAEAAGEPTAEAAGEDVAAQQASPQIKQEEEQEEVAVAPAPTRRRDAANKTRGMQSPDRSAPASTRTMGTRRTRAAAAEKDAEAPPSKAPVGQSTVSTRRSRRGAAVVKEEEDGMVTPATQRLHTLVQKMTDIEV